MSGTLKVEFEVDQKACLKKGIAAPSKMRVEIDLKQFTFKELELFADCIEISDMSWKLYSAGKMQGVDLEDALVVIRKGFEIILEKRAQQAAEVAEFHKKIERIKLEGFRVETCQNNYDGVPYYSWYIPQNEPVMEDMREEYARLNKELADRNQTAQEIAKKEAEQNSILARLKKENEDRDFGKVFFQLDDFDRFLDRTMLPEEFEEAVCSKVCALYPDLWAEEEVAAEVSKADKYPAWLRDYLKKGTTLPRTTLWPAVVADDVYLLAVTTTTGWAGYSCVVYLRK